MVVDVNNERELTILGAVNNDNQDEDNKDFMAGSGLDVRSVLDGGDTSIATASPQKKNTVTTVSAATLGAMKSPPLEDVTCNWSAVIICMTTFLLQIKCQVDGCNTLVHHVCQGLWEASQDGTEAPGCSTLCCAHHPCSPPILDKT